MKIDYVHCPIHKGVKEEHNFWWSLIFIAMKLPFLPSVRPMSKCRVGNWVIVSKKNKQTKKNMSFIAVYHKFTKKQRKICILLQCITNSHKSWTNTKKHQNDVFGRRPSLPKILMSKKVKILLKSLQNKLLSRALYTIGLSIIPTETSKLWAHGP